LKNLSQYTVANTVVQLYEDVAMVMHDEMPAKCIELPKNTSAAVSIGDFVMVLTKHSKKSTYDVVRVVRGHHFLRTRLMQLDDTFILCCMFRGQDIVEKIIFKPLADGRIKINIDGRAEHYYLIATDVEVAK